ncbi:hypothetical protein [Anabaena azotica]|uniref:Uncharacterized protein n=1 Tax=Anabaena azotica FACHB-119 TaxID=947527 RepID=A0ABR8DG13_9NOST|nr:hypothetical protein [Anabaena azotica]MBD2504668.1 hypothetical protein [Anabaena azotica FACHB-119]
MTQLISAQQPSKSFNHPPIDEQAAAQAELYKHLETQAQAVAPEEPRVVDISFYDKEYYVGSKLIATVTHDDNDFVTQRWVVMVNGTEVHRAATPMLCHRYICIHYKDGSLPVEGEETPTATTGNEIMVQIFDACEQHGLELLEDGIYQGDEKLGEAGCTNGNWWFTRTDDVTQQQIFCNSASDAVWLVSRAELPESADLLNEYLQYHPLEQMPPVELKHLLDSAELLTA